MTDSTPKEEKKAILALLEERVAAVKRILGDDPLRASSAVPSINRFRYHLAEIFGEDSPLVREFPKTYIAAKVGETKSRVEKRLVLAEKILQVLKALPAEALKEAPPPKIFIGHGRSPVWREFKDFIRDDLSLQWDEFNREATAGISTTERLGVMLQSSTFAFLLMTGDDDHGDEQKHARPNVVHEIGLFQGRLGLRRAIVLLEDGCAEFSNIAGLTHIPFPRGRISACFEDVRRTLKREGLIP